MRRVTPWQQRPARRLAAWIPAAVDPDPGPYEQMMWSLAGYPEVTGYAEMFQSAGFGTAVELASAGADRQDLYNALPFAAAYRVGLVGDVEAVRTRPAAYASAGLDEVVAVPATAGDPADERTLTAVAALR